MVKKDPLISVNLTTYNRSNLLKRSIDSVLAQTYKNIELIVVDDSSTDETKSVVENFLERDKRIRYIRHDKNEGLAVARNTAFKNSNGYYIAFMDDDDEWIDKNKLKKQISIFSNNKDENIGIVCTSVKLIRENNKIFNKIITKPKNLKKAILRANGFIYSPTVLTKKSIVQQVGGFDTCMKRGVDSEFYRNCIVRYNYNIYVLQYITTAIYENHDIRITPLNSRTKIINVRNANIHLLKKYFIWLVMYPSCFYLRLKIIVINQIKLLGFRN